MNQHTRLDPIAFVDLAAQRARLEEVISQGRSPARAITRARILLKADGGPGGPHWTDTAISQATGWNWDIGRARRL